MRIAREVLAGTSGVVSIEGEAGIGKTALAHRAPGELDDGFLVLRAVCDPSEQDLAFEVVAQLVAEVPVSTMRAFPLDKIGANRA